MQARVRIGVVGAGRWGRNLIRAFSALDLCEVAAVCDADERLLRGLNLPDGTLRFTDLAPLLQTDSVQAVVIATPASFHATQTIRGLTAGKHVFVEKPMATSLKDAEQMRDAAIVAKRRLMVGHLLRFHPAILELRRLIEAGGLGEIQRLVTLRLGAASARRDECPWWCLAPHDVSLVRYLLNSDVVEVSATRERFADGSSEVTARLGLTAAGRADLVASTASQRKTRRLLVFGTKGTALFDDGGVRPTLTLVEGSRNAPSRLSLTHLAAWEPHDSAIRVPFLPAEPLLREAMHFISALRDGGRVATDADEGCAVMAALEAGALSMSREGGPVRVSSQIESTFVPTQLGHDGFA